MRLLRACKWLVLYSYAHGNSSTAQVDCVFQSAYAIPSHYELHLDITLLTYLLNDLENMRQSQCGPVSLLAQLTFSRSLLIH
jgi:hypothetical protein